MTYICPFCHQKMIHHPKNQSETKDDTLKVEVTDTFKCGCSINQVDSDGTVWLLNSWQFKEDGWYHLGSTDGSVITEKFIFREINKHRHEWVRMDDRANQPDDPFNEVVQFT